MTDNPGPEAGKAFYLTTPIYYVNDAPHIGHAYTTVAGDVLTRWHRQRGEQVWFLTGTDEHGEKILRTAEANDVTPQEWADRLVEDEWRPVWRSLDIANDDFIRTTEPRHTERVQDFLQGLYDNGEIYEGVYEGPYCVGCEEFKLPGDLLDGTGRVRGRQGLRDPRQAGRVPQREELLLPAVELRRRAARALRSSTPRQSSPRARATRCCRSSGRA